MSEEESFSEVERDAAYEFAGQKIAKAKADGAENLYLSTDVTDDKTKALTTLPQEIADLSRLQELYLSNTQVSDLSLLQDLSGLQVLYLNSTQVGDLSQLQGLGGLQRLVLNNTQVSDLSPLQGLSGLRGLVLDNTQVSDLSPLKGLSGLRRLDLYNTQVSDLSPLQGLSGLQTLFLNNTQVSDLSPLERLSALQRLTLTNTQVSDLSPLKDLSELRRLDLNDTPVSDLSALRDLRKLQVLSLQGSKAADLSPLSLMIDLRLLNLKGSQVADLLPLAGLSRLGDEPDPNLYPIITFGLWFGETPAADRDAAHRALATIENPQDRVKQVLQYLNGEHPEFGGPPEPFVPAPPPPAPEQQKGGVRFRPEDDYLQPLAEGEIGARAEAMKPMVIEALEAMTQPLPGSNDFPGPAKWAVEALMLVRRDLEDIDAEGWRLWALSQKFARRVEADDKAQADPDGMEKSMGAQMREAVDGVVDSLPLFVRQFPECRYYDTETADRARDRSVEPAVAEVLDDVAAFEIVRPEVGEHLRANLPVEEDGREAGRQAGFNLFTARNVVYAGLGVVAATLVQEVTLATLDAYGGRAALTQRIEQWLTSKPDPIREILKDAPADVRASALTHIERLKASPAPWQAKVPPKKP